ncbi:hypothetical protein RHSIM_Rhsim06G0119600 [Rhododendron simsii]|uniref:SWIM-type domain-containing protein n=1 Tax=Rhododendron simsii TaxID=118357 RepID=A0A834GW56_RHOSS|nr:hypothetical protein RHSIM_Rhsim06G0119600 [Rhododendron simsii]
MPPAYFDLIINHKGKVARLPNIDPDKYCYFDLVADLSEKLLSHYPRGLGLAISIFCELPGTGSGVPQLGDDEGNMSSGSDEVTKLWAGFDTSYYGKEPYVDCEREVVLEEKMIFADVDAFRAKLRDYTVEKGFKIVRDKNEKPRVTAHCDVEGCPWRIHASPLPDGITYQIKTYTPEHTCTRVNHNEDANSTWIAKKLLKDFKENPQLDLDDMQEKLNGRFGIESSRIQLYRARRKCMDELEGSHGGQYKLLPTYAVEVRKTNPGSLIKMDYNRPFPTQNPMFGRLFVSFAGMIKGFLNGCRPFIGVDGCHLKGPYGGVLISAVALDGNNGLFPLAVAVAKYPGLALRKQFWIAARAYNQRKFDDAMATIKELNTEAHGYLVKLPVNSWARHAFDDRVRSDHITNNGAESFNNWLGNLRGKPILTMLEGIRCKVMSRIQTRHQKGVAWTHGITANIKKLLIKVGREARHCKAKYCGGTEYDVMDNGVRHLVDLGRIECVCRQWEISGIPCKHAMAAIMKDRKNVEDFVHSYYSKEMYLRAHGSMIHPILDHSMWTIVPGDPLDSPPLRRLSGRPRKARKRAANEPAAGTSQSKRSQTVKCMRCKEFGHNKRTCQGGPIRGRGGPTNRGRGNNRRGSASGNEMGGTPTLNSGIEEGEQTQGTYLMEMIRAHHKHNPHSVSLKASHQSGPLSD